MELLPSQFVIFDTEFTAWEGSQERNWGGPNEYREVIQVGAVKVVNFEEVDTFLSYVRPVKNPLLSVYIKELTGISQHDIDVHGIPYAEAQTAFHTWCTGFRMGSFGSDAAVLEENSALVGVPFPFSPENFFNIREVFSSIGIDTLGYMSSTIPNAFGVTPPPLAHDAQNDARSILLALKTAHTQGLL